MTPLGLRKLKPDAIPAFRPTTEPSKCLPADQNRPSTPLCDINVSDTDSVFDTPRKIHLKKQLNIEKRKREKCRRENMNLKKRNKYFKTKNNSLRKLVKSLKIKKMINKEDLNELEGKAEEANNDFLFAIAKKRKRIPPTLRKFYATLHYYSPAAYKYVRGKFNNTLPHPRTISKWYEKSDVSPGFTQQAFEKLHQKSKMKFVTATLVVDEMAIRQRTTWNGRKTMGLVDEGLGPKDEVATQAYVFMLVSSTENWKIPLGYFFINGLRAEQRASLIQMCITKCYDVGVDVIALTFDGCAANVATAEILGCNFENINSLQTTFPHPTCNTKRIALLFDACHMLKLVRNTFDSKKLLFSEAGRVEWLYLVKLQKLQETEGFKFANKLTVRHIAFRNQIMKVNLASQLLSRSVAKALTLCSEMVPGHKFSNVEPTVEFLETFNDLFDVFNSTTYKQGFKRSLGENNETETFNFLDKAEDYIKSLKIYNKVKRTRGRRIKIIISKKLVTQAKCKMGFLGFLIDIQSLKYLYRELVQQNKVMNYMSTYRFSQDHLELFFGLIRQHGGRNNNPTTEQFRGIYKKALCHLELRSSFTGNCLPIDNFSILGCSSALEKINMTTSGLCNTESDPTTKASQSAEDEQCEINSDILSSVLDEENGISDLSKQIVGYISGWVVKKIVKKIKCHTCCSALISDRRLTFHRLINLRNLGGLLFPTQDVYDICIKTESLLKLHKKLNGNHYIRNENEYKVFQTKILKLFIESNVFNNLNDHSLEQPATWNHKVLLIKSVIKYYADVRLHYVHKNVNKITNRQKYNKLILFQGE